MIGEWDIVTGDCRQVMRGMKPRSIHCVVTSPPYWGLRDYGAGAAEIGRESTVGDYIARLVNVFDAIWRVLRDDGTLWLNMGDSYSGSWGNFGARRGIQRPRTSERFAQAGYENNTTRPPTASVVGLAPKNLMGVPWRLAFALQQRGWILRSDIIWHKPNPMPESVTDRPTRGHEYVFLLTKQPNYFYDGVAVRTPFVSPRRDIEELPPRLRNVDGRKDGFTCPPSGVVPWENGGANLRTVWTIPTQGYDGAHFATYPYDLVARCLRAGTSEAGCCPACRSPWRRVVDSQRYATRPGLDNKADETGLANRDAGRHCTSVETIGWETYCRPKCKIGARGVRGIPKHDQAVPCVVLDPFAGAGTTGVVAQKLGRSFIGIELNETYAAMARDRIRGDAPLFNQPEKSTAWA